MKIHPTASESRTAQCSKIPKKVQFGEVVLFASRAKNQRFLEFFSIGAALERPTESEIFF